MPHHNQAGRSPIHSLNQLLCQDCRGGWGQLLCHIHWLPGEHWRINLRLFEESYCGNCLCRDLTWCFEAPEGGLVANG